MIIYCSSCLLGKQCLWHGNILKFSAGGIAMIAAAGHIFIDSCPEILGGLSCPRPPSYRRPNRPGLLIAAGKDVTPAFELGARRALAFLREARPRPELALLLAKSPSCDPGFGIFGREAAKFIHAIACNRKDGLWLEQALKFLHILPPQRYLFQ
jgi:uncharacterized protein YbbK (DUF523 family)